MRVIAPFFFIMVLILSVSCKKKPLKDERLIGLWSIDSIQYAAGGTAIVNTDSWNTNNLRIVLNFKEDFSISSTGYHYEITGQYEIKKINGGINISVKELVDKALRPATEWQPKCIGSLNEAVSYRIEDSQLFIYTNNKTFIIRLTRV